MSEDIRGRERRLEELSVEIRQMKMDAKEAVAAENWPEAAALARRLHGKYRQREGMMEELNIARGAPD